jgi:CRP-like cAMP-binding protein
MKVILVQESKVVANLLRVALRGTRYGVAPTWHVCNAEDFIRFLEGEFESDTLVVFDWNLPGIDSATLLTYFERSGKLDRLRMLFCVNPSQASQAEKLAERGARESIVRPFSDEEFRAKLEELDRKRMASPPSEPARAPGEIRTDVLAEETLPRLFSLPSGLIARLFEQGSSAHYEQGDILLEPGDSVNELAILTSGEVEIEGPEGRERREAGECYAESAFIDGVGSNLQVRALGSVDLAVIPKKALADLAREHPAMQKFLADLLRRPLMGRSTAPEAELSGTLASLSFHDLVQVLNSGRKTGVLILVGGTTEGRIYFDEGEVTDARTEDVMGVAAFLELSGRSEGRFSFTPGISAPSRSIHESTLRLIMNSYRAARFPANDCCAQAG